MALFQNVTYISISLNKEFGSWILMIYCLAVRYTKSETKTGIYRFWASKFPVSRFWEKLGNSKPYYRMISSVSTLLSCWFSLRGSSQLLREQSFITLLNVWAWASLNHFGKCLASQTVWTGSLTWSNVQCNSRTNTTGATYFQSKTS